MCILKSINGDIQIHITDLVLNWEEARHWYEEKHRLVKINKTDKVSNSSILGFKNKDYLDVPLADSYPINQDSVIFFKRVPLDKSHNYIPRRILFNFRYNKAYPILYEKYQKIYETREEIELMIKTSLNEYNLVDYDMNRMYFHPVNCFIKSNYSHVLTDVDKCVDVDQYFYDISNKAVQRKRKHNDFIGENYVCHRCRGYFTEKHLVHDCPSHKIKNWVRKNKLPHGRLTCQFELAESEDDVFSAPYFKSRGDQILFYHPKP